MADSDELRNKDNNILHQTPTILPGDIKPGWSGHGLKGNRSAASLGSCSSHASGLFIEGDDQSKEQVAGEQTHHVPSISGMRSSLVPAFHDDSKRYLKTTNMASFYYRKFHSSDNSLDSSLRRSFSHGGQLKDRENDNEPLGFQRQKSRSHTNLGTVEN